MLNLKLLQNHIMHNHPITHTPKQSRASKSKNTPPLQMAYLP